ncbi:UDP-N-acetylmuramoyl-L-alanine--D-glutamate ligase [Candidatus Saccharibacteria bacterium]|nr:UDP-N-acetylmuramoyl-L-alanine--D-glutamate ligase [Candidatus Saccharibacteria bacterium]
MNRLDSYHEFIKKYPDFTFESYSYDLKTDHLDLSFCFKIDNLAEFRPSWRFPRSKNTEIDEKVLNRLVLNLGLAESMSYWKATCSPNFHVEAGPVADISWWSKQFKNGLAEFFYRNGLINKTKPINFIADSDSSHRPSPSRNQDSVLVPVGGGKDSVVSLELLKTTKKSIHPFVINPKDVHENVLSIAGLEKNLLAAERKIDPKLLELNDRGFLNGHTPFSLLVAFASSLAAYLNGIEDIALSNESSANEKTAEIAGQSVNHQYSKSLEFEKDFRAYIGSATGATVNYFSLLRPLEDTAIAALFAEHKEYFDAFRSCNLGSKESPWVWCKNCPKCLFTNLILAPFTTLEERKRIFGADLFADASLLPIFKQLIGDAPEKPFECVGTVAESYLAAYAALKKHEYKSLPPLLEYFEKTHTGEGDDERKIPYFALHLSSFAPEHNLPFEYEKLMNSAYPTLFRAYLKYNISGKSVCVLGLGREGKSTLKMLESLKNYKSLTVADDNFPKDFDKKAYKTCDIKTALKNHYDLYLKSPGVASDFWTNSETNLFLEFYRKRVIGITGTKGKSTTASLMYHVLKETGKDVVLGGNIGVPVFDLVDKIDSDTIIVLELSCHQLEYLDASPNIAVLTNLYSDHLDRYKTVEKYHEVKSHIYKYQTEDSGFFITEDVNRNELGPNVNYLLVPTPPKEIMKYTKLTGDHYRADLGLVDAVVSVLGIPMKECLDAFKSFKPLPHRLEHVLKKDGVDYYDDSISTTPETAIAACEAVESRNLKYLLVGGLDRGIDYEPLEDYLLNHSEVEPIFFSDAGRRIFEEMYEKTGNIYAHADNLPVALRIAVASAGRGSAVILSPAAASYNEFKNFEERGDFFQKFVRETNKSDLPPDEYSLSYEPEF